MKTLGQLIQGLEILATRGELSTAISDICHDSRKAARGSLFVCMPGTRVDGHTFMRDALDRGAVAVMAETEVPPDFPAAFIRVGNTRSALAAVSAIFFDFPALELELVGITGTNGKTTTSLLIESILHQAGFRPGVLGTIAYRWAGREVPALMTTPESLDLQRLFREMADEGVTHVVMEVSSHALALGRVAGLTFRAGVFTNLSQDHLDFHRSMDDYFRAKALLFSSCLDPRFSAAVINADDAYGRKLLEEGKCSAEVVAYGVEDALPAEKTLTCPRPEKMKAFPYERRTVMLAKDVHLSAAGISAMISTPRGEFKIDSPLVGRLNVYNVLAAVSAASALDVPDEVIAAGIRAVSHVDGRLQRVAVPDSTGFHVIVDYAHTPDALEKALVCLREMTTGRLIAVFGCGGDRDRGKRPQMGSIAARLADLVIITSDNPRTEDPEKILDQIEAGLSAAGSRYCAPGDPPSGTSGCYTRQSGRREAIEFALSVARPGDIVFIGGKGHETYQIIGTVKHPFDDRLVVKDYFQKIQVMD
ncbi:MAG: UDP-N-acetylmuramoyl-L-alanyl-D-glutamate--2,6-diaminopimelate ligase [Syntrophobacteraceae bacterium]